MHRAGGSAPDDWQQLEERSQSDNDACEKDRNEILAGHRGEFAFLAGGRLLDTFGTAEQACAAVMNCVEKHGIVTLMGSPRKTVEPGRSATTTRLRDGWKGHCLSSLNT